VLQNFPLGPLGLVDELKRAFGADAGCEMGTVPAGKTVTEADMETISGCAAVQVVMGPRWLGVHDDHGRRRLDDPEDFVRVEIESALRSDKRVLQILVGDAQLPGPQLLPESLQGPVRYPAWTLGEAVWSESITRRV